MKFNNYVDFVDEEIVSALAAEWIEIGCVLEKAICRRGLRPRGGVD